MSMEKINSEELNGKQERIPLTDDELEQVSGGRYVPVRNMGPCEHGYLTVSTACLNPPCSKLCNNNGECTCADGPSRGICSVPDTP